MRLYFYIALFIALGIASCTLKRDNPLDVHATVQSNTTHKSTVSFSRYVVSSDNNNDGIVNPGETIGLQIFVKNNSSNQVNKVKATVTCNSSFVSSLLPTTAQSYKGDTYDDYLIAGSESAYGGYPNNNTQSFTVASTTPDGTVLTFNMTITDDANNTWTDTFNIHVQKTSGAIKFSRYVINSDNNNDGKVNKGETIGLRLFLKNTGVSQVNKVKATITCSSSYVSGIFPTTAQSFKADTYDDFIPGGSESSYGGYPNTNTLSFSVSNATPVGTVLTFNISATDESNNTWTDTFSLTVLATDASIKYSRAVVSSDNSGDGIINPGETIGLQVFLKNTGTSQANKVKGTITCSSSYITNFSPLTAQAYESDSYDDFIPAGSESAYGAYPNNNTLSFKVSGSTPTGTVLNFNVSINDESNNTWTDNFALTVH